MTHRIKTKINYIFKFRFGLSVKNSDLGALSTGDECLPNILNLEHRRGLDIVPILLSKRIRAVDS